MVKLVDAAIADLKKMIAESNAKIDVEQLKTDERLARIDAGIAQYKVEPNTVVFLRENGREISRGKTSDYYIGPSYISSSSKTIPYKTAKIIANGDMNFGLFSGGPVDNGVINSNVKYEHAWQNSEPIVVLAKGDVSVSKQYAGAAIFAGGSVKVRDSSHGTIVSGENVEIAGNAGNPVSAKGNVTVKWNQTGQAPIVAGGDVNIAGDAITKVSSAGNIVLGRVNSFDVAAKGRIEVNEIATGGVTAGGDVAVASKLSGKIYSGRNVVVNGAVDGASIHASGEVKARNANYARIVADKIILPTNGQEQGAIYRANNVQYLPEARWHDYTSPVKKKTQKPGPEMLEQAKKAMGTACRSLDQTAVMEGNEYAGDVNCGLPVGASGVARKAVRAGKGQ